MAVVRISDYKALKERKERLKSDKPYCGICFDEHDEIVDLEYYKFYGRDHNGMWCPLCGEYYE